MAKLSSRLTGPLAGGLLAGVLGAIAWVVSRQQTASAEPPPPPSRPPAPAEPPGNTPDAQPPVAPPPTTRPGARAFIGMAVSIGLAGVVALAAVALTPIFDRAGAWRLPLAIAGGLLLLAGCVFIFPRLVAPTRTPEDLAGVRELSARDRIQFADDRRKLQNDVRTALLQAVAGGAVLIGVLFTWQQQQATSRQIADQLAVTRQGQVGERFSRAVGQLGSNSIDVRLGGLYELEQLARQAPERRLVIFEVVAAYVRQHARSGATTTGRRPSPAQDVAAAMTIVGRRSIEEHDGLVDLSRIRLGRVNLSGVVLRSVDLSGADLRSADLSGANLSRADLNRANLSGADLRFAELSRSVLPFADLRGARLDAANLNHASVNNTDLRGANLGSADLSSADLGISDLRGADLSGADLSGADLDGARATRLTQWPPDFDWRSAGVVQSK